MIVYTKEKLRRLLKVDFVRFCIVGGLGFLINLVILTALHRALDAPIFLSQVIGAEVALLHNFLLHEHWTYKGRNHQRSFASLVVRFHVTSWPAIFGSAAMVTFAQTTLHFNSTMALVISSAVVLLWNFTWSKYVVWRHVTKKDISDIVEHGHSA